MGAQEHSDQDRLALDNEDPTMRDGSDLEEEDEDTNIEKSIEQLQYERVEAWKRFKYPGWATPAIWALFFMNVVSVVLTLDQWHGMRHTLLGLTPPNTHAHRHPLLEDALRPVPGRLDGGRLERRRHEV